MLKKTLFIAAITTATFMISCGESSEKEATETTTEIGADDSTKVAPATEEGADSAAVKPAENESK